MNLKQFLNEANKKVKIVKGDFSGSTGKITFSKEFSSDSRYHYFVVELDAPVKGTEVAIVWDGEFDVL